MELNSIENELYKELAQASILKLESDFRQKISDGYHTFGELYDFRLVYSALIFNQWAKEGLFDVHKSFRHNDGELCFGGNWFIVIAKLPTGYVSHHYKSAFWDYFSIPEFDTCQFAFDGHTSKDCLITLMQLLHTNTIKSFIGTYTKETKHNDFTVEKATHE